MKTALKVVSWIVSVIGALAILGAEGDYYAIIGGVLFCAVGVLALVFINQVERGQYK